MNNNAVAVEPPYLFNTWPLWLRNLLRRDANGITPEWRGGWLLASGGGGTASVWVTFNGGNRVSARMVVKSIAVSHYQWWDPCEWSDGLNATGYRDFSAPINHALPLEAIINRRLTQLAGPPVAPQTENPICKYFGFAVDQRNRRWKLFLEYCPGGSLFDFHQSLIAAGGLQRPPEPFIWYAAEQCLLAIKIMQQGDTATGKPGWRPLIHRDMKTSNILFGEEDPSQFRHYPRLKLCDFGIVCETDENDTRNNPIEFNECRGTPGWMSQEQFIWYKRNGTMDRDRPLSEKTNIWGVGMICQALNSGWPNGMNINYNNINDRNPFVVGISPELRAFIRACLQYDPAQRPTIDEALAAVQAPTPPRDNFMGMRTAQPNLPLTRDRHPHGMPIFPNRDPYRLHFAKGTLPRLR